MLSLAFLFLAISAVVAFNEMRLQRDAVREEMKERFDALRYHIMMNLTGRPAVGQFPGKASHPGYSFFVTFTNGSLKVMQYEVESFAITMNDGSTALADSKIGSTGGLILPGRSANYYYPFIPAPTNPIQSGVGEYVVTYRPCSTFA